MLNPLKELQVLVYEGERLVNALLLTNFVEFVDFFFLIFILFIYLFSLTF